MAQGDEVLCPKQVNTEFDIQERGVKGYTISLCCCN